MAILEDEEEVVGILTGLSDVISEREGPKLVWGCKRKRSVPAADGDEEILLPPPLPFVSVMPTNEPILFPPLLPTPTEKHSLPKEPSEPDMNCQKNEDEEEASKQQPRVKILWLDLNKPAEELERFARYAEARRKRRLAILDKKINKRRRLASNGE